MEIVVHPEVWTHTRRNRSGCTQETFAEWWKQVNEISPLGESYYYICRISAELNRINGLPTRDQNLAVIDKLIDAYHLKPLVAAGVDGNLRTLATWLNDRRNSPSDRGIAIYNPMKSIYLHLMDHIPNRGYLVQADICNLTREAYASL